MSIELGSIQSAVKYDIEISGPATTVCNIPICHAEPTKSAMELETLRKILGQAEKEEVLLINLVLSHFSDIRLASVKKLIKETNKTIRKGVELSLCFPIEDAEEFITNTEGLKQLLLEQDIDVTHYFLPPELFIQIGKNLGKFMKEMAFESIHDSKVHTFFPVDETTQDIFLKGLREFLDAADIWKTYRIEFLNSYDLKHTSRFQDFIERMNQLAEITYSFLPIISKDALNEYDVVEDFEIRSGICLGGGANVAFGLNGEQKVCLQEKKTKAGCCFINSGGQQWMSY